MPFFAEWAINEIDVEAVDDYRLLKVKESEARAQAIERGRPQRNVHGQILRPLSAGSINRTIDHLQWVLSIAGEYPRFGVVGNAAQGKRRRLPKRRRAPAASPPATRPSTPQVCSVASTFLSATTSIS